MKSNEKEIDNKKAWKSALQDWNNPSIPNVIIPQNSEERKQLGEIGTALEEELAFMNIENFQTYVNLETILEKFPDNPQRGLKAVEEHEVGHRFCPYDKVTLIILNHKAKEALNQKKDLKVDINTIAKISVNLHTDTTVNTVRVRNGSQDIPWAYKKLSEKLAESAFGRVYVKSLEYLWKREILPKTTKLSKEEEDAALSLSEYFIGDFFDVSHWERTVGPYTSTLADFIEEPPKKDGKRKQGSLSTGFDDITKNIPNKLDETTKRELVKRLAQIGSNGMPTNPSGLKDFKEILAGYEKGDPRKASIHYYDMLSDHYKVRFTKRPFGRSRKRPFRPMLWEPSMSPDTLDVPYSISTGGRLIPGETTYAWKNRKRTKHGVEELTPYCDIYLDSSQSTVNPINDLSLLVLGSFVVAKTAIKKAPVRATVFSGKGQCTTVGPTQDLDTIFDTLTTHYNGGTVFPSEKLLDGPYPKQVLIATDTFLANKEETANNIRELRSRHKGNKVTIYALNPVVDAPYLEEAGAEVFHDTSTEVFKKAIGKSQEVYR
jgi:hypothetical protein